MKIGKIELTRERLIIAVSTVIAAVILSVYFVFFAPLMGKLSREYSVCKSAENEVVECRNIIESAGKVYGKRLLIMEKDISRALDELTKYGKSKGINFISISPNEVRLEQGTGYKILPIHIKLESTYRELASFLGSLDDMQKGVIKIESFEITPNKKDMPNLITGLVIAIYLSRREDGE